MLKWDLTSDSMHVISDQPVAVAAGDDQTVLVWNLATDAVVSTLTGHRDRVRVVACTHIEGRPVAVTASDDSTLRSRDVTTYREIALFGYLG